MPDNVGYTPGTGAQIAADDVGGNLHQRVKISLGEDGTAVDLSATNPMPVTVGNFPATQTVTGPLTDAQLRATPVPQRIASYNYPISTANSSTAQLAAGATFTGTIESPQDQPSISILLTSDQPITLTIRQFIDVGGTFAVPDIVFYIRAGVGFSRSLALNGNFVQVTARNTGASTTTTFNLNTAFGTLGDADSAGLQPVTELPVVLDGAAAQTAIVNNILTPTAGAAGLEVSGLRSGSIQVVSTGTGGTFIFEQSNDNVNWVALPVYNAGLATAVPIVAAITATASAIFYTFPIRANFLRLRIVTTITGGNIRAFSRLSSDTWTPAVFSVAQGTAANLQVTADTEFAAAAALADGAANPTTASGGALVSEFNGTTWDRMRGNTSVSVEASSAKTVSGNSAAAITNHSASGVILFVNVSAVSGTTPTLAVRVQVQDPVSTTWVDVPGAVTASITGVSLVTLALYPGVTVAANAAVSYPLPRTWRLAWTIGGTTPSFTFSVGAQYIK